MMNENDLLSIKEFSELTGIKQSTLRHYDEVKLFQPVKRGENGYRYYSAPQAVAINFINVMSNLGIPLRKISEIQKVRTPKLMLDILHKQELALNRELFRLQQAYSIIHAYCGIIQEGLLADEETVSTCWMEASPITLGQVNDFSNGYFYDSFFRFLKRMDNYNIDAAYPAGGFYTDMDAFLDDPGHPTRFFSLTPVGKETKEAGEYLVGYARGYYGHIGDLPQRIKAYADEFSYTFIGPVYELYLHDEVSIAAPDQFLIQASAQVKKRR
ncbi:MAG: MerR family DNA-binding transcriptional regulator [Clostridiales bacterium]|nr:MerR family DNA-binding transcriptional regulator [Clostridiales bacterium]